MWGERQKRQKVNDGDKSMSSLGHFLFVRGRDVFFFSCLLDVTFIEQLYSPHHLVNTFLLTPHVWFAADGLLWADGDDDGDDHVDTRTSDWQQQRRHQQQEEKSKFIKQQQVTCKFFATGDQVCNRKWESVRRWNEGRKDEKKRNKSHSHSFFLLLRTL